MKMLSLNICFFLFFAVQLFAQDPSFSSSNLPIIKITTNGLITANSRVSGNMEIIYNEDGARNYVSASADHYSGRIEIELHGQSSLSFDKKSYRFETQDSIGENDNVSLLGLPKENDWILYAPYSDKTLMRNALAYTLASQINDYAPRIKYCEIVVNGEYRGVYILTEKIKRDKNRVNISELEPQQLSEPEISGGYIFKKDKIDAGDNIIYLDRGVELVITEPDKDDIAPEQTNWLKSYLNSFDNALTSNSNYQDYIDLQSFVDNFLMVELSKNIDGLRLSTYFYKDRNGKVIAGPVWDYNLAWGNADYNYGWTASGWYYETILWDNNWVLELLKKPEFNQLCIDRWQELRKSVFTTNNIYTLIEEWEDLLGEAQQRNFAKFDILGIYVWPNPGYPESGNFGFDAPKSGAPTTWQGEIDFMKSFIDERLKWMDNEFGVSFTDVTVDVNNPDWGQVLYNNKVIASETYLGSYTDGALITLRAEAKPGYKFVEWVETSSDVINTNFINTGARWKYLDNGSDQGTAWRLSNFDDSAWQEGTAELGYGDNDESTVVSYGPDAQNKYVTTYFRTQFNVTDSDLYTNLNLYLLRDDGAVAYLNGFEILRSNMPETGVYYNTYASEFVDGANEKAFFHFEIDPQYLFKGENIIAVEIHQQNATSSDISFDLSLSGTGYNPDGNSSVISSNEKLSYLPTGGVTRIKAVFAPVASFSGLVINEIYYNALQETDAKFIELCNTSNELIDFSGYAISGVIDFVFPDGTGLAPGAFAVLSDDSLKYTGSGFSVFQWEGGDLSDNGGLIKIQDLSGATLDSVTYGNTIPWPQIEAADYRSLELKQTNLDNALGENWQKSTVAGGSPGKANRRSIEGLVINEFLSSNENVNTDEYGDHDDWIELYNAGTTAVDAGGLYLSDKAENPRLWKIADISPYTTTIKPDSFLVIWADEDSSQGILHGGFQLSKSGEAIILSQIVDGEIQILDSLSFPAQQTDVSMGREPDGSVNWTFFTNPTPGSKNLVTGLRNDAILIKSFTLEQNYPNPFNPVTTINYTVGLTAKGPADVSLVVFDILGREIETLVDRKQTSGSYSVQFNASELPSGIYIYRLKTDKYEHSKKMLFLK